MNDDNKEASFQIELSIVDLTIDVRDDASGSDIPVLTKDVLESLSCNTAEEYLSTHTSAAAAAAAAQPISLNIRSHLSSVLWRNRGQKKQHLHRNEALSQQLQQQVVRFLKVPDKYIALTSILLKSQAFHKTHSLHYLFQEGAEELTRLVNRPVVDIPRTQYKKPYIPIGPRSPDSNNNNSDSDNSTKVVTKYQAISEVNFFPMSVSHQFPFCGIARLVVVPPPPPPPICRQHEDDATITNESLVQQPQLEQPRPLIGLDIVTFDDYNSRLYSSLMEFLSVFESSFTPWEWKCIMLSPPLQDDKDDDDDDDDETVLLREFYLHWAMKEAYTKALGVGMGLSFDSFEIRLELPSIVEGNTVAPCDKDDKSNDSSRGVYRWIRQRYHYQYQQQQQQGQQTGQQQKDSVQPIRVGGVVVTKAGLLEAKEEPCTFVFVPLWDSNHHYDCDAKSLSSSQLVVDSARSFACICLLPQPSSYSLSFNEKSSDDGSIQNDFIFGNTSILVDDDRHVNFLQVVWQSLEELIQWHRRC